MQAEALDGPRVGSQEGTARQLVVLLDGLGADGHDLIQLAPHLGRVLPGAAFVAPHAPFACDVAPMGRQWFSLARRDPELLYRGAEAARPLLERFVEAELRKLALAEDALAYVGFSQGTMMALHTALRRPVACAGVVGFSGLLIGAARLADEIASRPPVLLVHGEADEVVAVNYLPAAEKALAGLGVAVEAHRCPGLGHGIDETGLRLAAGFLRRVFAPAG